MKKTLLTLVIISTACFLGNAQTATMFDSILNNTMNIANRNFNIQKSSRIFKTKNPKRTPNISSIICNSSSDIIVQFGDSLYSHNLSNNQDSYITGVIHGISASFDVIERNDQFNIVTSASWDSIYYFVDSSWVYSGYFANSDFDLIHVGCGVNAAFFMGGHLWYFNGNSNPKLIRMNIGYAVADLVVDERDNAWVLTGKNWPIADTLRIIDSTGFSVCDIPLETPTSTLHGYGMIIHEGKAMVGFGGQNPNFPNSIVFLKIDSINNIVKFENPQSINPLYITDFGSCSKSILQPDCTSVNTNEINLAPKAFNMFPVPFNDFLNIESVGGNIESIKVYDVLGRIVIEQICQTNNFKLHTEMLKGGVYYIQILQDDRIYKTFATYKY